MQAAAHPCDGVGKRLSLTTGEGMANYQGLSPPADHEPWLTRTAEIRRPTRPLHLADRAAAAWARLAGLAVHRQEIAHLHIYGVAHACAERLNGLCEHGSQGRVKPRHLVVSEAGATTKRVEASVPADLVGVGIADASHEGLIGEHPFDFAPVPA